MSISFEAKRSRNRRHGCSSAMMRPRTLPPAVTAPWISTLGVNVPAECNRSAQVIYKTLIYKSKGVLYLLGLSNLFAFFCVQMALLLFHWKTF